MNLITEQNRVERLNFYIQLIDQAEVRIRRYRKNISEGTLCNTFDGLEYYKNLISRYLKVLEWLWYRYQKLLICA